MDSIQSSLAGQGGRNPTGDVPRAAGEFDHPPLGDSMLPTPESCLAIEGRVEHPSILTAHAKHLPSRDARRRDHNPPASGGARRNARD